MAKFRKFYMRPTTLYYIKIMKKGRAYYKIGITTTSVEKRFVREIGLNFKLLMSKKFKTGRSAYAVEQKLLKMCKALKTKDKVLECGGNSEVLDKDVSKEIERFFD